MGQCQSSQALVTSSLKHDFPSSDARATKVKPISAPQTTRNASITTAATVHSSCQSPAFSPLEENEAAASIMRRSTTQARHLEKLRTGPLRHSAPPAGSLYQQNPEILRRQSSWFTLSYRTGDSIASLDVGDYEYTTIDQSKVRRVHHNMKDESVTEDATMEDLSHYIH